MKGPRFPLRLADSGDEDALLREVLGAAKGETMTPARVASTLATFEAGKVGSGAPAGKPAGKALSGWRTTLPARFGASLALACALGAGWWLLGTGAEPSTPSSPAGVARPAATTPAPADTTSATRVEDLPPVPAPSPAPAAVGEPSTGTASANVLAPARPSSRGNASRPTSSASPSTSSASSASSFHEELALVETARSALAQGDSASCLRALDRHDQQFRGGVFADEISMMRIEALAARGEHERARKLGEAFLERHPDSAYASRIRSVLSTGR